ncbi:ABC-type microcin C transport system permease subunit YejE [Bartonella japonica]|uniref:ABC-type microcin C transport system permease subunit YejE n=1 Tax=Bartonella japonica TaxID=357761 RepID=A0ABV2FPG0_9HYPH
MEKEVRLVVIAVTLSLLPFIGKAVRDAFDLRKRLQR